jgi:transketolase
MVAAAAGMASCGKIPFITTAGAFLSYRSLEFIRNDVCFQQQNVKIIGSGSGLSISMLGPTHHTTEDTSVLRALPGITIFSPASPTEVRHIVHAAYTIKGPVYIRLGMGGEPEIYSEPYPFTVGSSVEIKPGRDITLFSTGSIIPEVLSAALKLAERHINARVINVHTLKPMDKEAVIKAASETRMLFTVEEHTILGGLGGIIAEILAEMGAGVKLKRIGLPDSFATGYGSVPELRRMNCLDSDSIFTTIFESLGEK